MAGYLGKMLKPNGSMTFKHAIFINQGFCGGKRFVPAVYTSGLVINERDAPLCRGSIAILLI